MTPHEKAKDIYQKMFDNMPHPNETNAAVFIITKQCALIVVDEILNVISIIYDYDYEVLNPYWEEVKKQIEAL